MVDTTRRWTDGWTTAAGLRLVHLDVKKIVDDPLVVVGKS